MHNLKKIISELNIPNAIKLLILIMIYDPEDATTSLDLLVKIRPNQTLCFAKLSLNITVMFCIILPGFPCSIFFRDIKLP